MIYNNIVETGKNDIRPSARQLGAEARLVIHHEHQCFQNFSCKKLQGICFNYPFVKRINYFIYYM